MIILQDNLRHDHQQQNFREDRRHPLSEQGDSSSQKIKTKFLFRNPCLDFFNVKNVVDWWKVEKHIFHRKLEPHADISFLKSIPAKCLNVENMVDRR